MRVYDSLEQTLKELNKNPKIYLCGPTVYDHIHIGNLAPVLIFDFLIRVLRHSNENYIYIHNITDIDDKIIAKAKELSLKEEEVSQEYTAHYLEILKALNIIPPTYMPKVSEHIGEIQNTVQELLNKGFAEVENGDVIMKIEKISNYGELSKQKLNMLKSNEDFCLWKKMEDGKRWDSAWGKGRPGWHTECFTFISKYANSEVDLHGGGIDLKFPHHENENAHARALNSKPLAKIWMHIGHLHTEDGKLSKSSNKKFLVKDLLKEYSANTLRYLFLTNKYSLPLLINKDKLQEFNKEFESYLIALNQARSLLFINNISLIESSEISPEFLEILNNDLNLPTALTWLQKIKKELLRDLKNRDFDGIKKNYSILLEHLLFLGFQIPDIHTKENLILLNEWKEAQNSKEYSKADEIREELKRKKLI